MAIVVAWIARKPPSARHSYGLARIEVIAALLNGLLMLAVVLGIVIEAVERFHQARLAQGGLVMGVALVSLMINVAAALILSRGRKNLNIRAALLHIMGDLVGSVAALMAGAVIYVTGWTPINPILSLVICALLLYSTQRLLRDAMHVLMEGVPSGLDLNVVGHSLARVPQVVSVHVVLRDLSHWLEVLEARPCGACCSRSMLLVTLRCSRHCVCPAPTKPIPSIPRKNARSTRISNRSVR